MSLEDPRSVGFPGMVSRADQRKSSSRLPPLFTVGKMVAIMYKAFR
jgi:hypothetical protein